MENKLKTLLDKTSIDKKYYSYFEKGNLESIVTNDTKDCCLININLDSNLPLDVYLELKENIKNAFPTLNKVVFILNVKKTNIKIFYDYLEYLIKKYDIELLKNNDNISYKGNKLIIDVELSLEQRELIIKKLKKMGYIISIEYIQKKEIKEPIIEKEEVKEEPKKRVFERQPKVRENHPDVIYGRLISDPITRMDTIIEVNKTITVEGYIFGLEKKELKTKDGREFKIMNFKLTDFTDSIYGTLFLSGTEEFPDISENNWYKIRAQVKEPDKYNQDMSLSRKRSRRNNR